MATKNRLDIELVRRGLCESREKAQALIMAGLVYIKQQKCDKAGLPTDENVPIEIKGRACPFVSRGGLKLQKALEVFQIELSDKIAVDAGASTGGFTDAMLQSGAARVYAVDVGYGQLAWQLRQDPRVVNLERTNLRYVTAEHIPEKVDFISIDVAFISLKLVIDPLLALCAMDFSMVCLIKPQFEAGRDKVGKNGVVRDMDVHMQVVSDITSFVRSRGICPAGLSFSPVKGPSGNIEYLLYVKAKGDDVVSLQMIEEIVQLSHKEL